MEKTPKLPMNKGKCSAGSVLAYCYILDISILFFLVGISKEQWENSVAKVSCFIRNEKKNQPNQLVLELKWFEAAACYHRPFPLPTPRQQGPVPTCAGVRVSAADGNRWALEGARCIQASGAAQPNCLALVQPLIDPINSNESGFLQSDLLPLYMMCLSQSTRSWNLSAGFDKGSVRGGKEGKKRQITAECNQCFITIPRKWERL